MPHTDLPSPLFDIESPRDAATCLEDPTLRVEYQAIEFRVVGRRTSRRVTWTLDCQPVCEYMSHGSISRPLQRGMHTLEAHDGARARASVSFLGRRQIISEKSGRFTRKAWQPDGAMINTHVLSRQGRGVRSPADTS